LNVFPIRLPTLQERGDDIFLLAEAFLQRFAERMERRFEELTDEDKQLLKANFAKSRPSDGSIGCRLLQRIRHFIPQLGSRWNRRLSVMPTSQRWHRMVNHAVTHCWS
jgi:hypothetical protein